MGIPLDPKLDVAAGAMVASCRQPQDRQDLERLAELHGPLPEEPIPGLDS